MAPQILRTTGKLLFINFGGELWCYVFQYILFARTALHTRVKIQVGDSQSPTWIIHKNQWYVIKFETRAICIRFATCISWNVRLFNLSAFLAFCTRNYNVVWKRARRTIVYFLYVQHHICQMHIYRPICQTGPTHTRGKQGSWNILCPSLHRKVSKRLPCIEK